MKIEDIIKKQQYETEDQYILSLILSNRITHYISDEDGAAIAIRNWDALIDDILIWHRNKKYNKMQFKDST